MGEPKSPEETGLATSDDAPLEARSVATLGGRVTVRWDETTQATPHGQLVFFAEFLAVAGVFDEWVDSCPLKYTSGNAPSKRDVLGTLLLGILAGNTRYAHITGIRGDGLAAEALGISRVLSADSVRRALMQIDSEAGATWLRPMLRRSVLPVLDRPWILDVDVTVKPLYGHQQGAEKSYNPHKPGRPSHALHTYWVGNVRQVLDVQLSPGREHTSAHGRAGLAQILDELSPEHRPALVRGDCGYGNEPFILECEQRDQPYLFRLRQTSKVKRLLERLFLRCDWSKATEMSQGYEAIEDSLQLSGWSRARRVVMLRRRARNDLAITRPGADRTTQLTLALPSDGELCAPLAWEYIVLVTNTSHELVSIGQLYRDRCDCENGFDELKNQWGWGGFTTQDLARNQTMARTIALIYNWWSWYTRAAHPQARLEAATSRPLLLAAVGRVVHHAGQTVLHLTSLHGKPGLVKSLFRNVVRVLEYVRDAAQQLPSLDQWAAMLRYIVDRMLGAGSVHQAVALLASPPIRIPGMVTSLSP